MGWPVGKGELGPGWGGDAERKHVTIEVWATRFHRLRRAEADKAYAIVRSACFGGDWKRASGRGSNQPRLPSQAGLRMDGKREKFKARKVKMQDADEASKKDLLRSNTVKVILPL